MSNLAVAESFLEHLYGGLPGETVEFRLIRKDDIRRLFYMLPVDPEALRSLVDHNQAGFNIYFGVATRTVSFLPLYAPAAWIDVDDKSQPVGLMEKKSRSVLHLLNSDIKPSLVVDSGNGIHAYWIVGAVAPEDHKRLGEVNKRLAKKFGGDHVHDIARVLRLPGFDNVKVPENPLPVKVLVEPDLGKLNWELDDLERGLIDIDVPMLEARLLELIEKGNQGEFPSRSEADFAVVIGMIRARFSTEEIEETFNTKAIGERYREKGPLGPDYLARTMEAARDRLRGGQIV